MGLLHGPGRRKNYIEGRVVINVLICSHLYRERIVNHSLASILMMDGWISLHAGFVYTVLLVGSLDPLPCLSIQCSCSVCPHMFLDLPLVLMLLPQTSFQTVLYLGHIIELPSPRRTGALWRVGLFWVPHPFSDHTQNHVQQTMVWVIFSPSAFIWLRNSEWFFVYKWLGGKAKELGTSLAVQWLRLHTSMQGTQAWSLVRELRSHMPCGTTNK